KGGAKKKTKNESDDDASCQSDCSESSEQDGDSEDGDSDLKARKLKSENLETPPKDHAIIMSRLKSIVSDVKQSKQPNNKYTLPPAVLSSLASIPEPAPFRPSLHFRALATRYKNANTVDDDMPVDDDADKNVPKSRKRRRKANKFRRVRQAVMNAKKNELTKPKRPDAASAPTSKPKRTAGADEVKPASYAPGKFRDARLDFIRRQMHEQSLSWKEACKLWLPSAERASFLQGMSKSELSKRRFNV
ncbi:unnamed protein product, partial [Symbiodinium necroappetens]